MVTCVFRLTYSIKLSNVIIGTCCQAYEASTLVMWESPGLRKVDKPDIMQSFDSYKRRRGCLDAGWAYKVNAHSQAARCLEKASSKYASLRVHFQLNKRISRPRADIL